MIGLEEIKKLVEENKISYGHPGDLHWNPPTKDLNKKYDNEARTQIVIKKSLMDYFIQVHRILYNHCGQPCDGSRAIGNTLPLVFLLGRKRKSIDAAAFINIVGERWGCSAFPTIPSAKLNEALYDLMQQGAVPAGIARIGVFGKIRPYSRDGKSQYSRNGKSVDEYFGGALQSFRQQLKDIDFCLLSIGCWDINAYVAGKENGFNFVPCDWGCPQYNRKKKEIACQT